MSALNTPRTADRLKELTRPTGEEDVMHVAFPEPRVRVDPRQAALAVAVVLAALGAWAVLRPAPADTGQAAWPAASTSAPAPTQIVVSVVGEVDTPGLVTLEPGARVADALAAASPRPEADVFAVNQAQLLTDGQQIHVQAAGVAPPAAPAKGGLVSLNTATAEELTTLPGVGAATASAIIAHREANGPFTSVDRLMDVKGIGPAKFGALKDLVSV